MTDITTPAQMREAVEQAVLAEKMRMMSWCAKRQAVSRKAWERAARKALAGDMAELRNRIALIDAGPLDIVQSDAGDDALPVAEPEPQAVRVNPLKWVFHDQTGDYKSVYISGGWTISHRGDGCFALHHRDFNEGVDRAYQTPEAAQAAAEADHASRVRLQIDAVSVAQVRAEALREAVKLADEKHRAYFTAKGRNPDDYVSEYSQLAASIRALIEKEQT